MPQKSVKMRTFLDTLRPGSCLAWLIKTSAHIHGAKPRSLSRYLDTAVRCLLEEITQARLAGQIVSSTESRDSVNVKSGGQRRRDRSESFSSNANAECPS